MNMLNKSEMQVGSLPLLGVYFNVDIYSLIHIKLTFLHICVMIKKTLFKLNVFVIFKWEYVSTYRPDTWI